MVLCNRLSTEAYAKVYGEVNDYGITEYKGLVNIAIKPHLNNELFPQNNQDVLLEVTRNYKGAVYGLDDNSAVVVENDEMYVIGSKPLKIVNGILAD